MKKLCLFLALILCIFSLTACGTTYTAEDVAGKVYTYEKDGCGGYFTIKLFEDGTFQYYEGTLSSYIGMGTWTLDENILCLKDQETHRFSEDFTTMEPYVRTNCFKVEKDCLVWLAESSDNFLYVDVVDGDRFFGEALEKLSASSYFNGEGNTKYLVTLEGLRLLVEDGCTEERLGELLEGFTHDDLTSAWGQWDGMTSGIWSHAWDVTDTCSVWVVFDSDGYVSEVHLRSKE